MSRPYTIDTHPKKKQILRDLVNQKSYTEIAKQYGLSIPSVQRYMRDRLLPIAAKAMEKRRERDGNYVLSEIDSVIERLKKFLSACDRYLQDPDNPDEYYLGPHSHELYVIIEEGNEKRKVRMDKLIKELKSQGVEAVLGYEAPSIADPRNLILKTSDSLCRQLELLSKIYGLVIQHISIANVENWTEIKQVILEATEKNPEIRERIVKGISRYLDREERQ